RDDQALGVEGYQRCGGRLGHDVAADIAGDLFEPDRVAAAAGDFAIDDADIATADTMDQAAPCRQRNAAAVERDAGKADAASAFAQEHRGAAIENELGRSAHADQLRAA